MAISCAFIPTNENTNVPARFFWIDNSYKPLTSVATPKSVFFNITVTPGKGSPVWSVTLPLILITSSTWAWTNSFGEIIIWSSTISYFNGLSANAASSTSATVIPRKDPLTVYPTTSSWLKINFSFVCCCISSNSCSKPVSPKRRLIFFCCDHTSAFRLVVANAITRHISFILIMSQISFSIVFFINLLLTFNMIPLAGNFAGMYWRAFRLFTVR